MNTHYKRGRGQEYRVMAKLREKGYVVIRSAGSHGAYDLVAIHPKRRIIKLYQLKYGSKAYLKSVREGDYLEADLAGYYVLVCEVLKIEPNSRLELE